MENVSWSKMSTEIQVNNSDLASGFKNYYIPIRRKHALFWKDYDFTRYFLIVCLPNVVHLENAWKQDFSFEFKSTFIPLCITLWKSILYNAGKIAAFAPKLQRIKYGSNAGRKKKLCLSGQLRFKIVILSG